MSQSIVKFLKVQVEPIFYTTPAGVHFYGSVENGLLQKQLIEHKYEHAIKSAITDRDDEKQNALHVVLGNKLFVTDKTNVFFLIKWQNNMLNMQRRAIKVS